MRIARFEAPNDHICTGKLLDDRRAVPIAGDLLGAYSSVSEPVPISRFLPPIEPPNIFCIGRNYRAHAQETGSAVPESPLIFQKPTTAIIGHQDKIVLPASAPMQVDFEAELVIVIGKRAQRVAAADAMGHVLGFTCANDVSARDCQKSDKQWARAKGFDTFCPLGPWLVSPEDINPDHVRVTSRLNGQTMQDANSADMIFSCAELISYLSHQFTLLPYTLILTGTPEGVGVARTPPVFLRPGDRIEVEIEGIGTLANEVVAAER